MVAMAATMMPVHENVHDRAEKEQHIRPESQYIYFILDKQENGGSCT